MSIIKLNNRAVKDATTVGSFSGLGNLVFISRSTASSSASLSITSGIDSTYKEYIFFYNNMHPATDNVQFTFNGSDDTSSHSYNITKTTTYFDAYHSESDSETGLSYKSSYDLAQSTDYQPLTHQVSNDSDASVSGFLHLFEPSSSVFAKHFIARTSGNNEDNHAQDDYTAGYFNTTASITALDFKFSSGNCDSGTIDMYGVL
tara:strand:+ start:130 stop:738 length:609 start_codon:yes stop_codon:yes gene_type:complete